MIFLFENYSALAQDLYRTLRSLGDTSETVVIDYDGFLPRELHNPYRFFMGDTEPLAARDKPRYFNEIPVNDFWEIRGDNKRGEVVDFDKTRAFIYYAEPKNKRLVNRVDWIDEHGKVRYVDCYDDRGRRYGEIVFDQQQRKVSTTYFALDGSEAITENHVTGDIIVNYNKKIFIFHTKTDLILFFLSEAKMDVDGVMYNSLATSYWVSNRLEGSKGNTLIWQEDITDVIPGNMQEILGGQSRTSRIMVPNHRVYEKLRALASDEQKKMIKPFGYLFPFTRANKGRLSVSILTNSDQIIGLEELVRALDDYEFHVGALTEMSNSLMTFDRYPHVHLYPRISVDSQKKLMSDCDIYLDINQLDEILNAVESAFLNGMLVLSYAQISHNPRFTAPDNVFPGVAELKDALLELAKAPESGFKKRLDEQYRWADSITKQAGLREK